MRRFVLVAVMAAVAMLVAPAVAPAAGRSKPSADPPSWMQSKKIRKRIRASGEDGVRISKIRRWVRMGLAGRRAAKEEPDPLPCPTVDPSTADVYSGQCEVYPAACTATMRGSLPVIQPIACNSANAFHMPISPVPPPVG